MKIKNIAAAALAMALIMPVSSSFAEEKKGVYIGFVDGFNFTTDSDISGPAISTEADFDKGAVYVPAIGYRYGNGLRTEFEGAYRKNSVDDLSGVLNGTGRVKAKSLMANLIYDFNLNSRFMPYIGAGAGMARVDFDGVRPVGGVRIDDEDDVFAYQGIAGVSYWLSDALELALEYRYFATQDPDLRTAAGVNVESEYSNHGALFGLRWNFGGPRKMAQAEPMPVAQPIAAPAPAPEPVKPALPKTFIVFFDWDQSVLTPEATRILTEAAAYAQSSGSVRIEATGHADKSGSAVYNMGLSERRAAAVQAKLVALGIGADEIGTIAKGETDPLVPTADGVREPQNRRVEILLK